MLIVGAHTSIAEGYAKAATRVAEKLKGNAIQFYLRNPRGKGEKELDP